MIDKKKLAWAVRVKRGKRSLRTAAKELDISYPTLLRIEKEEGCDLETFAQVTEWIGLPMDYFRQEQSLVA